MTIRGDSTEYDLLKKWSETLPFFEEPKSVTTCEIGVREGLGSKVIMLSVRARIGKIDYKQQNWQWPTGRPYIVSSTNTRAY